LCLYKPHPGTHLSAEQIDTSDEKADYTDEFSEKAHVGLRNLDSEHLYAYY
jgi:hypothetical protein